jgi:sugar phosphate isomerase/epimerase
MSLSRRRFFQTSAAASAGVLLPSTLSAIEPIKRNEQYQLKLGLAAYSFRQWLDLKVKKWTMHDFIDFAGKQPLDAVELTQYYFAEKTPEYCASLKGHATRLGLDISGTAVGNNFCVPKDKLDAQIAIVKEWTEITARLGGKTMRIFAGTVAKGDTEEESLKRVIPAIQECCDHAAKYGVFMCLENHGGITLTPAQLLKIVTAVKHDWFAVNLDTGNFHGEDPYSELKQLAPYAMNVQVKTEISRGKQPKEAADLKKEIEMLKEVKYRGYVTLEYEASEDALVAVPRHLAEMRKLLG